MISRRRFLVAGSGVLLGACARVPTGGGEGSVRDVRAFRTTSWSTDPFAMGSYSFLKRGSTPDDREVLAEPIDDRVFFAGEATHPDFPATVHGAILSGRRAAVEVMDATDGTVVIVGAGAAGLAAAALLIDDDYDVIVLEGRDRVGGRMSTDTTTFGVPIDLGASWIHGVDGNPIVDLGARSAPFDYDDYALKGTEDRDFEIASELEHEYAADEDELSPEATAEGEDLGGGDHLVTGGYARVADTLAAGVPVALNVNVEEIRYDGRGVEVVASNGTHRAAAVIVTVPLGVLQAGRPRFSPALPAVKSAAIGRLGMGVLMKAVLQFDTRFWDDTAMFGIAGRDPRTEWTEFVNLEPFLGKPILMGFSAGRAGRRLEALPPAEIVASAMAALQAAYP